MGNTQTGTHAHTETVETVLLGQWEYVSAYYSLWFSVSTFLGFIMWRMCSCRVLGVRYTNRRPCYLGATISWNSWKKRGRKREKCAEQFCALFSSFPGHSCSCVLKMLERWTLQFYPHFILHLGRKLSIFVTVFLAALLALWTAMSVHHFGTEILTIIW